MEILPPSKHLDYSSSSSNLAINLGDIMQPRFFQRRHIVIDFGGGFVGGFISAQGQTELEQSGQHDISQIKQITHIAQVFVSGIAMLMAAGAAPAGARANHALATLMGYFIGYCVGRMDAFTPELQNKLRR